MLPGNISPAFSSTQTTFDFFDTFEYVPLLNGNAVAKELRKITSALNTVRLYW